MLLRFAKLRYSGDHAHTGTRRTRDNYSKYWPELVGSAIREASRSRTRWECDLVLSGHHVLAQSG
jgi:hypothetical protein